MTEHRALKSSIEEPPHDRLCCTFHRHSSPQRVPELLSSMAMRRRARFDSKVCLIGLIFPHSNVRNQIIFDSD